MTTTAPTAVAVEPVNSYCPSCGRALERPREQAWAHEAVIEALVTVTCPCGAIVIAQFWRSITQGLHI